MRTRFQTTSAIQAKPGQETDTVGIDFTVVGDNNRILKASPSLSLSHLILKKISVELF